MAVVAENDWICEFQKGEGCNHHLHPFIIALIEYRISVLTGYSGRKSKEVAQRDGSILLNRESLTTWMRNQVVDFNTGSSTHWRIIKAMIVECGLLVCMNWRSRWTMNVSSK
jgi:hypothetical protein